LRRSVAGSSCRDHGLSISRRLRAASIRRERARRRHSSTIQDTGNRSARAAQMSITSPSSVRNQASVAVAHSLTLLARQERDDIRIPSVNGQPAPDSAIGSTEHFGNFLDPSSQSPRVPGESLNCIKPPAGQVPIGIRYPHQIGDRTGRELALDH